jgi:hypothetical protein
MSAYEEKMAALAAQYAGTTPSGGASGDGTPGSTLQECIIPGVTKAPPSPLPGGTSWAYFQEPQPEPGYRPVLRLLTMVSRETTTLLYTDAIAPRWFAAFVDPFDMQEVAPELAGSTQAQLLAAVETRLSADVFVRIGAGVDAAVRRDNKGRGYFPPPAKAGRWWGLLAAAQDGGKTGESQITVAWEYRRVTGTEGGG